MNSIDVQRYSISGTEIGVMPISEGERGTRRTREKAAVRHIVDVLLGKDAAIEHNSDGAPLVKGTNISISHSRLWAVVAVNPQYPIGIDAEEWRDALIRTRSKYLSEEELQWAKPHDLLALWTIKEAVYKAAADPTLPITSISTTPFQPSEISERSEFSEQSEISEPSEFSEISEAIAIAKGQAYKIISFTHHTTTITLASPIASNHNP